MTRKVLALDIESPCVDHGFAGNGQGYGRVRVWTEAGYKSALAHRTVFEMFHGYRPPVVMHICDNPRCINLAHLAPGDWGKNNKDRAAKGRSATVRKDRRTLSDRTVREIRNFYTPKGSPGYAVETGVMATSKKFGVDTNVVYWIASGRTYRDVI